MSVSSGSGVWGRKTRRSRWAWLHSHINMCHLGKACKDCGKGALIVSTEGQSRVTVENVYGVVYEQINNSAWEGHSPGNLDELIHLEFHSTSRQRKESRKRSYSSHIHKVKFRCKLNIKQLNVNLSRNLGDCIDVY